MKIQAGSLPDKCTRVNSGRIETDSTIPPGPRGNPFFGSFVVKSRREPLRFVTHLAREYGDVSSFRIGFDRVYFINHPDYIKDVLVNHYDHFLKGAGRQRAKRFLGEGLLLSEGDLHRRQRRLAQPAFHRARLAAYAQQMAHSSVHASRNWRQAQVVDVWQEMLRLTLDIVGKTLFSADVESKDDEVGQAMKAATLRYRAFKLPFAKTWERMPLPQIRRFHQGKERLRKLVLEIIDKRRQQGRDHGDLLSMLLVAEEEGDPNSRMTAEQVWDEALTIFIAGYDTMATALMWTWHLLSQNPKVEARLHEEVDEVLTDGRPATMNDIPNLVYTERVLAESMRIYPPTWRLVRRAITDFSLGEYVIRNGSLVVVSQYAMHRDPRFFPEAESFDPDRWTPEGRASRPAYSYFPFGGGPRRCLGESFALMEGILVLATLARRWRLRAVVGNRVEVCVDHLLRSRNGMPMRLEKRF